MLKGIINRWASAPRWKRVAAVAGAFAIAAELAYAAIATGEPGQIFGGAALFIGAFIILPMLGLLAFAGMGALLVKTGVADVLARHGDAIEAAIKTLAWVGGIAALLTVEWPYITTDFRTTRYALQYQVPVDRITFEKKPWDCDFDDIPMGNKHCHYAARAFVVSAKDSPGGKKSLVVAYEKVQE